LRGLQSVNHKRKKKGGEREENSNTLVEKGEGVILLGKSRTFAGETSKKFTSVTKKKTLRKFLLLANRRTKADKKKQKKVIKRWYILKN